MFVYFKCPSTKPSISILFPDCLRVLNSEACRRQGKEVGGFQDLGSERCEEEFQEAGGEKVQRKDVRRLRV